MRSVALQPGRDAARNARLFAAAAQAMDDALISVFEAKYHHNFWRPATAIRNGDADGHDGTARDASSVPMIDSPMHPEYPNGHAILARAWRRWNSVGDFVREVSDARIYEGVHFRFSTEVGAAMGLQIGELAAARLLQPPY